MLAAAAITLPILDPDLPFLCTVVVAATGRAELAVKWLRVTGPNVPTVPRPTHICPLLIIPAWNCRDVWALNTKPFDGEFCTACGRYYDGAEKRQIRVKDGKRYCRCGQHD